MFFWKNFFLAHQAYQQHVHFIFLKGHLNHIGLICKRLADIFTNAPLDVDPVLCPWLGSGVKRMALTLHPTGAILLPTTSKGDKCKGDVIFLFRGFLTPQISLSYGYCQGWSLSRNLNHTAFDKLRLTYNYPPILSSTSITSFVLDWFPSRGLFFGIQVKLDNGPPFLPE